MTERDGAAIDVDLRHIEAERLQEAQHHRGERLVDLDEINIGKLHAGGLQHLFGNVDRTGQHQRRIGTDIGKGAYARARFQTRLLTGLFVTDKDRRRAVDNARRIAGMVDVIDIFDFRMRLDGDGVEAAELAHLHERRLQGGERLHGRSRTHVFVLRQDGQSVDVLDRHHRTAEAAFFPSRRRTFLAFDRVSVNVVARKSVFGRDQVGGNALRQEIMRHRDRGIDRPGAAGRANANAAHRFDAAADRHFLLPGHDLRGGKIHRIEAGGAEAIDLHAGNFIAVAGNQRRSARNIGGRLADRIDDTHHHVVDQSGVQIIAGLDGVEHLARQIERGHLVQRAVDLAAAARAADGVVNECVGHEVLSLFRHSRQSGNP